ncbi:hypothetical protein FRC12_024118 [Ceratobasidium sp. 428]|nr:hypothetical protein FRC12_024118 [Ceratobasidium sp. 428]
MRLEGRTTNDVFLRAICTGYDEIWFGKGGYQQFVADATFDIDLSEYGLEESASSSVSTHHVQVGLRLFMLAHYLLDGHKKRRKPSGQRKVSDGLMISSMGTPEGSPVRAASSIPASSRDPTSLSRAAARSALLHGRIDPADANEATVANPSTSADSAQVSPKAFSPPSLLANAANALPPSPTAAVRPPLRSGVLPPLPSPTPTPRPNKRVCFVDLAARASPKAVRPRRSEPTKVTGAERTGRKLGRKSY